MTSLKKIINGFLADFPARQRDVIEERFGLNDERLTLAAIGEKYNLTRERIRQIESVGLESIRKKIKGSPAENVLKSAVDCLAKKGGISKEDDFIEILKKDLRDKTITLWQIKFLFEVAGKPYYFRSDNDFHAFWYLDKEVLAEVNSFIAKLEKFLKSNKEEVVRGIKLKDALRQAMEFFGVKEDFALSCISVSKKFKTNSYGDFGLAAWEEINPKTIGAKAYLILKKERKSLHFKDIARKINESKFDNRPALEATVHNELIKHPRFVLVGRGYYNLSEFGHKPGTAKDVIARILKEKGPMLAKEVVNLVSQERFLKENTILLNLQNRKIFRRMPDGKYHLA